MVAHGFSHQNVGRLRQIPQSLRPLLGGNTANATWGSGSTSKFLHNRKMFKLSIPTFGS